MTPQEVRESVRACVHQTCSGNAAVQGVLAEAEAHGWEKLLVSMSDQNKIKLIKMLAESGQQAYAILELVGVIYDQLVDRLAIAAEQELDHMEIMMDAVCCLSRKWTRMNYYFKGHCMAWVAGLLQTSTRVVQAH